MNQATRVEATAAVISFPKQLFRMIICFCTFGFVFPNAFVEGLDLTAIQRSNEGTLYDKKEKNPS
jgi:hypothetical protein